MNKEIASIFSDKLNEIAEIRDSILKELRKHLMEMGEQDCVFDDGAAVPIDYIDDDGDEDVVNIDKIKVTSNGIIEVHDADNNAWCYLSLLDNDAIYTIIEYIDWK